MTKTKAKKLTVVQMATHLDKMMTQVCSKQEELQLRANDLVDLYDHLEQASDLLEAIKDESN